MVAAFGLSTWAHGRAGRTAFPVFGLSTLKEGEPGAGAEIRVQDEGGDRAA